MEERGDRRGESGERQGGLRGRGVHRGGGGGEEQSSGLEGGGGGFTLV